MRRFVGRRANPRSVLRTLVELEYDAVAACSDAIERLENPRYRIVLERFRADHQRHARAMAEALRNLGDRPPEGRDLKAVLAQGKIVLGSLASDRGILTAMRSNEHEVDEAYGRALSRVLPEDVGTLLKTNLDEERQHEKWLGDTLSLLGDLRSGHHA